MFPDADFLSVTDITQVVLVVFLFWPYSSPCGNTVVWQQQQQQQLLPDDLKKYHTCLCIRRYEDMFSCIGQHSQEAAVLLRQEEEKKEEEEEQDVVQLDGGPPPPPVQYEGPIFPPQAGHILPSQNQTPILGDGPFRDPLEEQVVEW